MSDSSSTSIALPWLEPHQPFPPVEQALDADSPWPGLLAAGGVLDAVTLRMAYAQGIFPWYSQEQPILWWSTDPRMVLRPRNFRFHKSLRKRMAHFQADPACEIRVNHAFEQVMHACAEPREGQDGTWITPDILSAYVDLHHQGLAYSVETWVNHQLVGGLYGVALGHAVFGESMFTRIPDASKIALAALIGICSAQGVEMIDCQQETAHLAHMGASPIPRAEFLQSITRTQHQLPLNWTCQADCWRLLGGNPPANPVRCGQGRKA